MIGIDVALGLALAVLQPPPPPMVRLPNTSDTAVARLKIPDEIAPAIVPYLRCKLASGGMELRSSVNGPVQAPTAPVGADCKKVREQAALRAERMLRDQRRGPSADHRAFVERALTSIDDFLAVPLDMKPPPQPAAGERRLRQSVALPGEVADAVQPYLSCMVEDRRNRLMGVSTGEAARDAIQKLRADCASLRDQAAINARASLRTSRTPAARHEEIIKDALTAVDRSRDGIAEHLDSVEARRRGSGN
jgi:hypothetical protein